MQENLFRELLASDVLSGRRHEVPWRELASTQFSAENETKSWELLRDWAQEHAIDWDVELRGDTRDDIYIEFIAPSDPTGEQLSTPKADGISRLH